MNDFFYETEFEEALLNIISLNYSVKNPEIYIIMRYMIINHIVSISKININDLIYTVLNENNLPNNLLYKDSEISLFNESSQSLINIVKNWIFELEKSYINDNQFNNKAYIENNIKSIFIESTKNNTKYNKSIYYKDLLLLNSLELLNLLFNAQLKPYHKIDNLKYEKLKNKCYLEQNLKDKIKKFQNLEFNTKNIISEKELELLLIRKLYKVEKGLTFIQNQYPIKNAVIDILAEDINKNKVIIELKTKQDERLLWQSIYYPMQYLKEHKRENNVRMITICPFYEEWLSEPLKTIKNIEMFSYNLHIENNKIKDINIKKTL